MKKLLVMLMCITMLSMTACGNKEDVEDVEEVTTETSENDVETSKDVEKEEPEEEVVDLDDYVGFYYDGENDVTIEKAGDNYTMEVGIFRLTTLDGGKVSATADGVLFETTDAAGDPITVSFCKDGEDYTLEIVDSTWAYLENGQKYTGFYQTTEEEAYPASESDLEDGEYYTNLVSQPSQYANEYITSISFEADCIVVDASFAKYENGDFSNKTSYEKKSYVLSIDGSTKYCSGGGDGDPIYMSSSEFEQYVNQCMDSGLGLSIIIEGGLVKEIGIWS